jgi:hypothetical protein
MGGCEAAIPVHSDTEFFRAALLWILLIFISEYEQSP